MIQQMTKKKWLAACVAGVLFSSVGWADSPVSGDAQQNEALLLSSLNHISANRVDDALKDLEKLTAQRPDFRLAQLIYADLLAAQAGGMRGVGQQGEFSGKQLEGLLSEARARLKIETDRPENGTIPASLIKLSSAQTYAVVMDVERHRLFVFKNENGVPRLIKDYYASYGRGGVDKYRQGDLKTPLGVYFVTGRFSDAQLPPRYGSGALPINYPNVWDEREGRTGNGIWLHGSPFETYSRPPAASEGCISLSNPDFVELDNLVNIKHTPVIVGKNIQWISQDQWLAQQTEYEQLVEQWRVDWESKDSETYLGHYSQNYKNGDWDFDRFAAHKRRVNGNKQYIDVDLSGLSLFRYPDRQGLMVATFEQDYKSNNYKGKSVKRQYWVLEDNRWKIAYEGAPSRGIP
ncbi:MAG: L,D-transpeptidase family protein [Pontibacterium sp.]